MHVPFCQTLETVCSNMALREELDLTDWCDSSILRELNDQRRDGHMCDVIVCVDGKKIPAHRNVLAAASPFFRGMFGGTLFGGHKEGSKLGSKQRCGSRHYQYDLHR